MISQNLLKKAKKWEIMARWGLHYILCYPERAHALCGVILLKI